MHNGIQLIDGGIFNPVPIAPTFNDNTDMTIAVNLGGAVESNQTSNEIEIKPVENTLQFHEKVSNFIKNQLQQNEAKTSELDWGVYDVANQAFDAMQSTIARQKLTVYLPDHIIEISRNACGIMEFDRADEMIRLAYKKAQLSFS